MEAEESLSPRALLNYRLCGGAKMLADSFTEQYRNLRFIVSRKSSCDAVSTEMETAAALESMRKLRSLCRDTDFAADFAAFGGHAVLKEVLNAECCSDCVKESADDVVCSILMSGNTFPSRCLLGAARPTVCNFVDASENFRGDNDYLSVEEPIGSKDISKFTVYLRSIPGSIHGTGQHAVGYLLWSSAVILSRLLIQNNGKLVRNKVVLECGSGQGLCGIVAGRYAAAVTLSDFSEILVNNLEYNININQGSDLLEGQQAAIADSCCMKACLIDWNLLVAESVHQKKCTDMNQTTEAPLCSSVSVSVSLSAPKPSSATAAGAINLELHCADNEEPAYYDDDTSLASAMQPIKEPLLQTMSSTSRAHGSELFLDEENGKHPVPSIDCSTSQTYDVIIGSDLVYCKEDSSGILMVLSKYLSDNGIFVIVIPEAAHRYNTEYLVPTLQDGGFEVYYKTIAQSDCKSSEVTRLHNGSPSMKRTWTSARSSQQIFESFIDDFFINGLEFSTFLRDLVISDDHLVSNLDEEEYVAWQLIVGHRKQQIDL